MFSTFAFVTLGLFAGPLSDSGVLKTLMQYAFPLSKPRCKKQCQYAGIQSIGQSGFFADEVFLNTILRTASILLANWHPEAPDTNFMQYKEYLWTISYLQWQEPNVIH